MTSCEIPLQANILTEALACTCESTALSDLAELSQLAAASAPVTGVAVGAWIIGGVDSTVDVLPLLLPLDAVGVLVLVF